MTAASNEAVDFVNMMLRSIPHADALGMTLVEIGDGSAVAKIAYAEHLIGNPDTGVVHGGVITSLLDNTAGLAVQARLQSLGGIATLDLRIDYMKPAVAGEDIYAFVECYRATSSIAFVRGVAYHTDRADPIAAVAGAFMLGTNTVRKPVN
ncbi:hypothetical protein sos41_38160 [Alphaproteobacteria bacterium SO-S41]|nr:hypothetical protein sos41_38160 [Alphaproteobacteria bacterium SO-S41]